MEKSVCALSTFPGLKEENVVLYQRRFFPLLNQRNGNSPDSSMTQSAGKGSLVLPELPFAGPARSPTLVTLYRSALTA